MALTLPTEGHSSTERIILALKIHASLDLNNKQHNKQFIEIFKDKFKSLLNDWIDTLNKYINK